MRRKYVIGALFVAAIAFLVLSVRSQRGSNTTGLTISNLSGCSKGINKTSQNSLTRQLYTLVKSTNTFNEHPTESSYSASVRSGSCSTQHTSGQASSSTAIIDIPGAKQSWKVTFSWVTGSLATDLGSIQPACLPIDKLLYGDFRCTRALESTNYIDTTDPIVQYLPHSTLDYNLTIESSDKKILNAQLFLSGADQSNASAATALYKQEVVDYITSVGLNPADYTINYTVVQN
jgi:hypothetical protein